MCRSALYNLHFISQVHEVVIGPLFLLRDDIIALDTNNKSCCKLERDAEEGSFRDLVESHLIEQIIDTRDGDFSR
jgi:hypothetical protein